MIQKALKLGKSELDSKVISKSEFYKKRVVDCCPDCGSKKHIKYGFYNEIQRYKCKICGKTFSNATNSLWSYSKKDTKKWLQFMELLGENRSLRFCARELNISLVTAFYWRHKILQGLCLDSTPEVLKGIVHMGKAIFKESFKGCRNKEMINSENPRKNIWIIGAKGNEDSMFVKPIFKESWSLSVFNEKVYAKIEKKAYIVSYADRYLASIAKRHNKKKTMETEEEHRIKYLLRNLKRWLSIFHGVASKYLQRYLSFYVLINLDKILNCMEIMHDKLNKGSRFLKTGEIRIIESCIY